MGLDGLPPHNPPGARAFRPCVTLFVRGALRTSYFGCARGGVPSEPLPAEVLTVDGCVAPFYSIGLQLPVDAEPSEAESLLSDALSGAVATWKVFAPRPLSESELDDIFRSRAEVQTLEWHAYPTYAAGAQSAWPFALDDDGTLLYLNAIEHAASAMEMSCIAARNAANLVLRFVNARRQVPGGF